MKNNILYIHMYACIYKELEQSGLKLMPRWGTSVADRGLTSYTHVTSPTNGSSKRGVAIFSQGL